MKSIPVLLTIVALLSCAGTYSIMIMADYHQVQSSNVGGFVFMNGKAYQLEMIIGEPTDDSFNRGKK